MKSEETIFNEALAIASPQERIAFLRGACGDDAALRQQVEALLDAHQQATGFMQSPAVGLDAVTAAPATESSDALKIDTDAVGTTVGPYKLLERIGEGGMGVVYMADQLRPVRRRVALKIIKPGMDSRQVIARFEAERQALAMMDHPGIARVLDAGTTDAGRPYFAMELVRGVPITEYCDTNNLTPRERLGLFVQVCQAVQHAHMKGVIHRDLKPSNILVTMHDGTPVPKVIDFGIAKATGATQLTDLTLFTHFAQMIGTPLYMSPEQAEMSGLDVDTRSDVYSLGVLLYELLTGTTPFDKTRMGKAALDEMRRIIREEEPPRPSTRLSTLGETLTTVSAHRRTDPKKLGQSMRGELDWIVMKSLEKDRTRRYETASALAADVLRHLNDEAVEARPASAFYRFRKFARRNKGPVAAAAAVTGALTLGLTAATAGLIQANLQRNIAVASRRSEAQQRQAAEASELLAKQRLVTALTLTGDSRRNSNDAAAARESYLEAVDLARSLGSDYTAALCGILQTYPTSPPPLCDSRHFRISGPDQKKVADVAMSVRFLPDGQTALVGLGSGTIVHQDLHTGSALKTLRGDARLNCLALSPDGQFALSGGGDHSIALWDLRTGRLALKLVGHSETVNDVSFSAADRPAVAADTADLLTRDGIP